MDIHIINGDTSLVRELSQLLRAEGLTVHGHTSAEAFLQQPLGRGPSCALIDLDLPGNGGLELQSRLNSSSPTTQVLFLTGSADMPTVIQAMKNGAIDFLCEPLDAFALLEAIREAAKTAQEAWDNYEYRTQVARQFDTLTQREREVFELLANGKLNKQVAFELGIVEKTVKVHRARVKKKLRLRSATEMVRYALAMDLIDATSAPPSA